PPNAVSPLNRRLFAAMNSARSVGTTSARGGSGMSTPSFSAAEVLCRGFERRLVREDLPAVLVEPLLRVAVARSPALDELPECDPVMQLDEVAHLVHDDVVEHVVRSEHEAPVEAQRSFARARAPAAHLIAQRDPTVCDAERRRLGLRDQLHARARLAATLLLRQTQALEAEPRLDRLRELACKPCLVEVDGLVDLTARRAGADNQLGRKPVAHDHPVAAHPRRPAYVQLDQTSIEVDEAHGRTVGVVADGNACAWHAPLVRRVASVLLPGYAANDRTTIDALWPPNPNEFETATSRFGSARDSFGT